MTGATGPWVPGPQGPGSPDQVWAGAHTGAGRGTACCTTFAEHPRIAPGQVLIFNDFSFLCQPPRNFNVAPQAQSPPPVLLGWRAATGVSSDSCTVPVHGALT